MNDLGRKDDDADLPDGMSPADPADSQSVLDDDLPDDDLPDDDDPASGDDFFDAEHGDETASGRRRRRRPVKERKKLSQILAEIADDTSRERVSIDDMIRAMDGRAFGALLLIFGFPNTIPAPPGTSGILGLPLLYLSSQMMLGRTPWLPRLIAVRSMSRSDFALLVERVTPWLGWADRFMAPRLQFLVDPRVEKLLGALCLILSIVLVLPIPLGNMLPAFAICLIALGVLERDGLWILIGITVGCVSLVIVAAVVYALVRTGLFILMNAF